MLEPAAAVQEPGPTREPPPTHPFDADYFERIDRFDEHHPGDFYLPRAQWPLMRTVALRLRELQRFVGYGHFHLLSWDEALNLPRLYSSQVSPFSPEELEFLEDLFYADAARYGFFGEKLFTRITDHIPEREVARVPNTGHWLYKGRPLETYEQIRRDIGERVVLTSGVRGIMKQFLLFLNKAKENGANLSLASRSLAPPGFSYHGICDFDVGQRGFGESNFTERFTASAVYQRLAQLAYIHIRYQRDNPFGVRFEPWHIKIDR